MSRQSPKTFHLRFYLAYGIGALVVYALLMAFVLPWWHATNHPVVVDMGAGSAQKVGISYSPDEEPVLLFPLGGSSGYYWKWATELPPRPRYDLKMVFPEGTFGEVVFKQLEVIELSTGRTSAFLKIRDIPLTERPGIQLQKLVDGIRITAEPGSELELEVETAEPTAYAWIKTWAKASCGYMVCALIILFSLVTILQFPDRIQAYRNRSPARELVLTFVFALIGGDIHLHLLYHAMPAFQPGESDSFVEQAIRMYDDLDATQSLVGESLGSPGYAFFLSQVAGRSDWDLHSVVLVQGLLFCVGLALVGLAITRLVNAWYVGPALVIACMSPAALWANRHIGVESLGTTSVLFCLAAFLYIWKSEKTKKWIAYGLFGIAVAVSSLFTSAWILPAMLLPVMLTGTLVWAITTRRLLFWKLEVFWRTFGQVLLSASIALGGGYIMGNTIPGEGSSDDVFSGHPMSPAIANLFEIRAIQDSNELEAIINGRFDTDYSADWSSFVSDTTVRRSTQMLPIHMRLALLGKLTYWGFFIPDVEHVPNRNLSRDYRIRGQHASPEAATAVQDSVSAILHASGRLVHIDERQPNQQVDFYNRTVVGIYRWFYPLFFMVGLAGWLAGLIDNKYLAALFLFPYVLNILRFVCGMNLSSEFIQSMDALLLLGAITGLLGTNSDALQKPKDDTDRRILRPIIPKQLLRRGEKTPYVHHGN